MVADLTRRRLMTMANRLERDLGTLQAAYPDLDLEVEITEEAEAVRNLASAVVYVEMLIAMATPPKQRRTQAQRLVVEA